jgi:hypothetical protein
VDANGNATTPISIKFLFKSFGNNTMTGEYCFYTPNGNNVLSNGSQIKYKAVVQYSGYNTATCDVQNIAPPSTLPVVLQHFSATREAGGVSLQWSTGAEFNNSGFDVQRATSAGSWQTIGRVATKATGGNSSSTLHYSYIDASPVKGIVQYRLLQTDIDGKQQYSEIRTVREKQGGATVTLFPNPSTNGTITLAFNEGSSRYDVEILDNAGRMIRQFSSVRNTLSVSNLFRGQYLARIINRESGATTTERFVVLQ